MNDEMRIRARLDDFHERIFLHVYKFEQLGHKVSIMKTNDFEEMGEAYFIESSFPSIVIDMREAQALMDQLWSCGLRPTEGAGSAGAMAEAQKHLADLGLLTDRLLKIVEREHTRPVFITAPRKEDLPE